MQGDSCDMTCILLHAVISLTHHLLKTYLVLQGIFLASLSKVKCHKCIYLHIGLQLNSTDPHVGLCSNAMFFFSFLL